MKKRILILMALLVAIVTGAWAQTTKTIYVYPKAWNMTGCKIALYAWSPSSMFDDLYKSTTYPECYAIEVDKDLETCILVQLPETASNDWSNMISQTYNIDLEGVDDNILIIIKESSSGDHPTEVTTIDHLNEYIDEISAATHEYVDLGLSTGTLWATTNIGATNPEDYGDYFAWGETETNKSSYTWTTYKWRDSSSGQLTKYCTESSYGTVDNKTVLDLEDDAAYKNWGSDWRMPTLEELNELIDECSWEFMQVNGVKGYKVSGTKPGYTDRYIFLPAGGYKNSSYNNPNNEHGGYWLSTLNVEYCYNGMDLYFKSYFHNPDGNGERYNGQPIRPVYSTKTEPVVAPGLPIDKLTSPTRASATG
ncbi:MAG: hypothetical protein IJV13_04470 [Prevotella sp.]|nr:hypothetical protein [Prevotella sp.]